MCEYYLLNFRELSMEYPDKHEQLIKTISKFRDDEQEHHDTGRVKLSVYLRKLTDISYGLF